MRIIVYARYSAENQDEENIDPTFPESKFLELNRRSATISPPISSHGKEGQKEIDAAPLSGPIRQAK